MKNYSSIVLVSFLLLSALMGCSSLKGNYISYQPIYKDGKFKIIHRNTSDIRKSIKDADILHNDTNLLRAMDSTNFLSHNLDTIYYVWNLPDVCVDCITLYKVINQRKEAITKVITNGNIEVYNKEMPVRPSIYENIMERDLAMDDSIMIDWITRWDMQGLQQLFNKIISIG